MIWFRTDTGITRHRDFVALRLALRLGRCEVAGHMLCLFEAVAEHHETGNLAGVADTVIEDWAEWRGEAGKFVTALRESGWLTATNELHGWYKRHASMLTARVKKKEERAEARAASRKAKAEAKKNAPKVSKDSPRPSETNLDEFGPSDPTGPDRTGPDEDVKIGAHAPAPEQPAPNVKPKNSPPATAFVQAYHDKHLAATGARPVMPWKQVTVLAKAALKAMPLEEGLSLLPLYFRDEREPSAANFFSSWQIDKLRAKLRGGGTTGKPPVESVEDWFRRVS